MTLSPAAHQIGRWQSSECLQLGLQLLSSLSRPDRETLIEHAICLCDAEDGDPDFEPDFDGEDDGSAEPKEIPALSAFRNSSGPSNIMPCRIRIF